FDGLHIGHQQILDVLKEKASLNNCRTLWTLCLNEEKNNNRVITLYPFLFSGDCLRDHKHRDDYIEA
ncbi:MAG: hypothetical protein C4526_09780, partial [Nitrospiraceae bacterium]